MAKEEIIEQYKKIGMKRAEELRRYDERILEIHLQRLRRYKRLEKVWEPDWFILESEKGIKKTEEIIRKIKKEVLVEYLREGMPINLIFIKKIEREFSESLLREYLEFLKKQGIPINQETVSKRRILHFKEERECIPPKELFRRIVEKLREKTPDKAGGDRLESKKKPLAMLEKTC